MECPSLKPQTTIFGYLQSQLWIHLSAIFRNTKNCNKISNRNHSLKPCFLLPKLCRFLVVANGLASGYSLIQGLRCIISMIRGRVLFSKPLAWAIFSGDQVYFIYIKNTAYLLFFCTDQNLSINIQNACITVLLDTHYILIFLFFIEF